MSSTRQIHLDFHCSEHIKSIGESYDKKTFQKRLSEAKVNSINLFAKCHHSWSYYPTIIGKTHPHLKFDLFGSQIEACKEIGIKTYAYFSVGWSANDAVNHPEWCARNKDGSFIINCSVPNSEKNEKLQSLPNFYWKFMCLNNGYHDLIYSQIEEICNNYSVDGFWFDIYQAQRLCYCDKCRISMESLGYNIEEESSVESFNATVYRRHISKLKDLIISKISTGKVFFNGTTALVDGVNFRQKLYQFNDVQDLEDLPSTWGGYDKLALQSKTFLNAGFPITAMSGKFHTDWGEFGGFKHPDALKYEAASMISFGANCNFGDQLHPNGSLDLSTYENIGYAFDYAEKIEDYGVGGKPFSEIGLWRSFNQSCDEGISKILLETHLDFDIANFRSNLNDYKLIILPSKIKLNQDEINRLENYIKSGGSVVFIGKSFLNFNKEIISDYLGIEYLGDSSFDCDYTLVKDSLYPIFVKTPFLNYEPAIKVLASDDAEILADIYEPYFNRTSEHYCSHQKTPFKDKKSKHSAIIRKGRCIFIAHQIDLIYQNFGSRIHRDLLNNCIKLLYNDPMVKVNLPSAGRVNLLHQADRGRYIYHLLYSPPMTRGVATVIEDNITLNEVIVSFKFPNNIKSVFLIPDKQELPIHNNDSVSYVTIPEFKTHCALVFHYH